MKTSKILSKEVQLIIENELEDLIVASENLNPMLTYVKFILTDDEPNANGVRIPKEEFSNLIRSGLYMPLKMPYGEIAEGHKEPVPIPLGVITHLREDKNKIRGIAALWNEERPEDVRYIKERYAEGKPLDLSWEIGYAESRFDDNGIEILLGCVLRATTLVGIPAYQGRTGITSVSAVDKDSKEERSVKEQLEKLQAEVKTLEGRVAELTKNQLSDEDKEKLEEYAELKAFKDKVEAEAARQGKLAEIRKSFKDANIEKDDEFFKENEELLLTLTEVEGALNFFVSQLTPDPEEEQEEEEELEEELADKEDKEKVPPLKREKESDDEYTGSELGVALRELNQKKN